MAGQYWFNALAGAGQSIAQGIDRAAAEKKQEQDILKEAQGRAKSLGATLKGLEEMQVVPEGTYDKMISAQENMAPKAFIGFADQQAKQIGQLIRGGVEMQRYKMEDAARQAKLKAALADQEDQQRLAKAISMATDTDGNVVAGDVVKGYLGSGGQNVKRLGDALSSLEKAVKQEEPFKASGYSVDLPGGTKRVVVQTSKGAVQVLPEPGDTAAMKNLEMRAKNIADIRKLIAEGKVDEAHNIALALNLPSQNGGLIDRSELIDRFSTPPPKPATPPKAGTQPPPSRFKVIERK